MIQNIYIGTTIVRQPSVVVYYPGAAINFELTCDVNSGATWMVNGDVYLLYQLQNGEFPGHNASGRNILIMNNLTNNSQYICSNGINDGGIYRVLVAGEFVDLFYKLRNICTVATVQITHNLNSPRV